MPSHHTLFSHRSKPHTPFSSFLISCSALLFYLSTSTFIPFHLISSVCAEEPDVRTRKIVKVVTQTMVNGEVVDESSEVEQIDEAVK